MNEITAFDYNQAADDLLRSKYLEIDTRINGESEDYLLNVGEEQLADYLEDQFKLDFPVIDTENVTVDTYEAQVPGSHFPVEFFADRNKSYPKDVISYHVPYSGNINLLKFTPSSYSLNGGMKLKYDTKESCIRFDFVNLYGDPKKIQAQYQEALNRLFSNYGNLKRQIEGYNESVRASILASIKRRKADIMRKKDFLSSLGVPLKKKADVPKTFSVPKPQLRQKIVIKPIVTEKGYKPEPTLDDATYQLILKYINDIGKNLERMPSVYAQKDEESLRDHFLFVIDPNFEFGSASGETFNKSGKTDILLRHDSTVVFIAECKFWKGEKGFLETIDQLLGYLTWRDSKASIVMFVDNKDFTNVISTIKSSTKKHKNFVRLVGESDESWINYIFSLPSDNNREIKLAVMAYHLPK